MYFSKKIIGVYTAQIFMLPVCIKTDFRLVKIEEEKEEFGSLFCCFPPQTGLSRSIFS